MELLLATALIFSGFYFGNKVGTSVPDEPEEFASSMNIIRTGAFLAGVTFLTYSFQLPLWFLIPFLLLGILYFWKQSSALFVWVTPLFFIQEIHIGTPLGFVVTFLTGVLDTRQFSLKKYWPFLLVSLILLVISYTTVHLPLL